MTDLDRAVFIGVAKMAVDAGLTPDDYDRLTRRAYIEEHLARAKDNHSKAARTLGVHRNTLQRWIRELGLPEKKGPWGANNPRFGKGQVA